MPAPTLANLWLYALQTLALVAVAGVALVLLRPAPRVRFVVLRLAFAALLLLPLQSLLRPVPAPPADEAALVAPAGSDALTVLPGAAPWPSRHWVAGVLAAGVAIRGAWLLLGLLVLARVTRATRPADGHDIVRSLQAALGTRARVRWHDALPQPVTFGLWPAVVVLPSPLAEAPPARLRAVVCHELLHVQRRDWASVLVEETVRTLLWWHPAVWWLVDELQLAREQVIDQQTVAITGARPDYLDALLGAAAAPAAPLFSTFLRRRQLARRIASLAQEVTMSRSRVVATTTAATLALVGSTALVVRALPLAPMPRETAGPVAAGQPATSQPTAAAPASRPGPRIVARTPVPFPSAGANPELDRVSIRVLATVDASGAVVDTRLGGYMFRTKSGGVVQFTGVPIAESMRIIAPGASGETRTAGLDTDAIRDSVSAMAEAASESVRQWRVEPPVQAPATVEIAVAFSPSTSLAVAAGAVAVSGYGAMDRAAANDRSATPSTVEMALRVGGAIGPPKKVVNVAPVYPEDAKAAGIQGVVILETTIGPDGVPADVQVIRSVPGLDEAAIDAVRQWRYDPVWLNGKPVPVIMTMTVNFTLGA